MTMGLAESRDRWHACGGPCGALFGRRRRHGLEIGRELAKMMTVIVA